jgi:hypothetical protein
MKYDYIIAGGGLAGLYTAYQLAQSNKHCKILILERNRAMGGKIDTIHGLEAGAGRFSNKHHLLLKLIDELGLSHTIMPISNFELFIENGKKYSWKPINELIRKIIQANPNPPNDVTFLQYVNTIPGISPKLLIDFFGYSSELTDMNARDSIALMKRHFNQSVQYYVMKGGLSQITAELMKRIKQTGRVQMLTHRRVTAIDYTTNNEFEIACDGFARKYVSNTCICALTKDTLLKIPIFEPIYPMLNLIKTLPLCRIYSRGLRPPTTPPSGKETDMGGRRGASDEVTVTAKPKPPTLHDIIGDEKLTVNNNLRIIIPIDKQSDTVMISYTDNKYARFWKNLLDTKGIDAVNREHQRLLNQTFKRDDTPLPQDTEVFYWEHGVAYFAPGFDSKTMPKRIMRPFKNIPLFVCGENYSEKNNQWMEGALDTSEYILERI